MYTIRKRGELINSLGSRLIMRRPRGKFGPTMLMNFEILIASLREGKAPRELCDAESLEQAIVSDGPYGAGVVRFCNAFTKEQKKRGGNVPYERAIRILLELLQYPDDALLIVEQYGMPHLVSTGWWENRFGATVLVRLHDRHLCRVDAEGVMRKSLASAPSSQRAPRRAGKRSPSSSVEPGKFVSSAAVATSTDPTS